MMERPAGRRQPRILGDFKAKIALLSAFGNGEFLRRSFDREPAVTAFRRSADPSRTRSATGSRAEYVVMRVLYSPVACSKP